MPIGLGIGLNICQRGGMPSGGVSLTAPVLTLITGADDNTPLWGFDLVNPLEGDVIRIEWDDAIPYVAQVDFEDYELTAGDLSGDFEFDFGLSAFADGPWSWRAYHMRGASSSAVSNTVTETISTVVPFSPADLFSGGVGGIWLDFSDTATMFSDAGTTPIADNVTIQQMTDKSGNGHTVSQATSGSRPTWQDTGFATFDGTADHLFMSSSLDQFNAAAGVSIFALIKVNAAAATYITAEGSSTDNDTIYAPFVVDSATATTHSGIIRQNNGTLNLSNATDLQTGVFDNTKRRLGVIHSFAADTVTPYSAGAAGTPVAAPNTGTLTTDRFAVGALVRAAAGSFANIPELYQLIIVKKILSAQEISDLDTWLQTK